MSAGAPTEHLTNAMNFVELFMNADWVVKGVMILLVVLSLWSWTLIIEKLFRLNKVNAEADRFEGLLGSGRALDDIAQSLGDHPREPLARLLVSVTKVWRDHKGRTLSPAQSDLLLTQVDRELNHTIAQETDELEKGLSVLAVTATASPFIGLFGTVWGIMNAFSAIASMGDTNLTTVAPAISEALFATAIGLAAAIPAYMAYNIYNARIGRFTSRMEGFGDELMVSLTRRLSDKISG